MGNDEVVERLDTLIALFRLAFQDELRAAIASLVADPVVRAILDLADGDWVPAGDLKSRVSAATRQSERTVVRRIADLVDVGGLTKDGLGSSVRYKSSGLLGR